MNNEEALKVAADFHKSLETGDGSSIACYTKEHIRQALNKVPRADSHKPWYKAMERHADELEQTKREKLSRGSRMREKWLDRGIGFVLGIIGTLLAAWLKARLGITP